MNRTEALRELAGAARAIVAKVRHAPDLVIEGGGEWWDQLYTAAADLERLTERATDADHPETLREVPRWLVEHAKADTTWWGRMGSTRAGFACNGSSVLVVDDCPDAPAVITTPPHIKGFGDRHQAERVINQLAERARIGTRVPVRMARLEVQTEYLQIGPAVLSTKLVAKWAIAAARVQPYDQINGQSIDVTFAGQFDAVLFTGNGWWAAVMPTRLSTLIEHGTPVLQAPIDCTTVVEIGASE